MDSSACTEGHNEQMRRIVRGCLVLVVLLVGTFVTTGTAQACSCAAGSKAQHFKGADAVFYGKIVERSGQRWIDYGNASGPGSFTYTVEVDRVFKGEVAETQKFVAGTQGSACGVVFPKDGSILVYGQAGKGVPTGKVAPAQYSTGLCSGSYLLAAPPTSFGEGAAPPTSAGYVSTAVQTDAVAPALDTGQSAVPVAVWFGVAALVGLLVGAMVFWVRRRPN